MLFFNKHKNVKPLSFFKYKSFNSNTLDSLLFDYYWAQPITKMNDVFEGFNAFEKFKVKIKKIGLEYQREKFINSFDSLNNSLKNDVGALCLTTDAYNQLMWAHYGDSCKGICIEYYESIVDSCFDSFLVKVKYQKNIPEFLPSDMINKNTIIQKIAGTKNIVWAYENEYRIVHNIATKSINYKSSSIKAIYFGSEFNDKSKESIYRALRKNNVKYYQMIKSESEYSFKYDEVINIPRFDYYNWTDSELGSFDFDYHVDAFDKNRTSGVARVFIYTKEFVSSELLISFNNHLHKGLLNGIKNAVVTVFLEKEKNAEVPLSYFSFVNEKYNNTKDLVLEIYERKGL